MPGLSLSYNGYLYVHGNPVNLTDPSGQIIPIAAILLGAAAGAAISTVLEVGSQMLQGRSIDCLDMGSVGRAALEGAVMGGIGGGVGAALKTAVKAGQITRRAAAAYSAAADISTGVIWDMAVYKETPSDALVRNVAAFGVGTAAGAASERLLRSAKGIGRWLRGADDDVARAMGGVGDGGRVRAARRSGAEAGVSLRQQRTWYADDNSSKPWIWTLGQPLRVKSGIYMFDDLTRGNRKYIGQGPLRTRLDVHHHDKRFTDWDKVMYMEIPSDAIPTRYTEDFVLKAAERAKMFQESGGSLKRLANRKWGLNTLDELARLKEFYEILPPDWPTELIPSDPRFFRPLSRYD